MCDGDIGCRATPPALRELVAAPTCARSRESTCQAAADVEFAADANASGVPLVLDVKVSNGPVGVVVVDFDPPAHLTGRAVLPDNESCLSAPRSYVWDPRGLMMTGGIEVRFTSGLMSPRSSVTIDVDMSVHDLGRLLAKIALGWAVANLWPGRI